MVASMLLPASGAAITYTGVNLAGADFGAPPFGTMPGTFGNEYTYPGSFEIDYFISKGAHTFRLPFRWERLQPTLGAPFDQAEFERLKDFVNEATDKGGYVVLDPHNYATYWIADMAYRIGSSEVTIAHFEDFWERLAEEFQGNSQVIFGLMNEPIGQTGGSQGAAITTEQWLAAANAAIAAIRSTGASNLILVPGNGYTGGSTWFNNWYGTPNAQVMLSVVDPGNNWAFDIHQYFDEDGSGTDVAISTSVGVDRLSAITGWLRENGMRAFLGEWGMANNSTDFQAGTNMLQFLANNSDVWIGWTYWAAGPWWGEYIYTVQPRVQGQIIIDRPQLAVMSSFFVEPSSGPEPGSFLFWVEQNFTLSDRADPLISGLTATPNGDGVNNLMKYFLGVGAFESAQAFLPQLSLDDTDLVLTFWLDPEQQGATETVWWSENLTQWYDTDISIEPIGISAGRHGFEARVARGVRSQLFMRLVVSPTADLGL